MKAAKEGFIIILLLIVVVATLGILFYNCFPNNKISPGSIEYVKGEETKSTLEQVDNTETTAKEEELLNGTSDSDIANGTILASYTVGASDINRANRNGRIEEGKTNPFEPYVEEVVQGDGGEGGTSGESSEKKSSSSTGRLFESSKSK